MKEEILRSNFDRCPLSVRCYLISKDADGRCKLTIEKSKTGDTLDYYFTAYPDIKNFPLEELMKVDSDEKAAEFAERMRNNLKSKEEVINYTSQMENGVESVEPTDEARDMLVGTGYTEVYPKPLVDRVRTVDEYVTEDEPDMVRKIKESVEPTIPENNIVKAPMAPVAKTKTFKAPENKQSGFAEVIVLSVIVIVYLAIIVNLVIRLK